MKKIIVKAEVKDVDKLENRLMNWVMFLIQCIGNTHEFLCHEITKNTIILPE